jgi:hypothetical protein
MWEHAYRMLLLVAKRGNRRHHQSPGLETQWGQDRHQHHAAGVGGSGGGYGVVDVCSLPLSWLLAAPLREVVADHD